MMKALDAPKAAAGPRAVERQLFTRQPCAPSTSAAGPGGAVAVADVKLGEFRLWPLLTASAHPRTLVMWPRESSPTCRRGGRSLPGPPSPRHARRTETLRARFARLEGGAKRHDGRLSAGCPSSFAPRRRRVGLWRSTRGVAARRLVADAGRGHALKDTTARKGRRRSRRGAPADEER